jgi:hypothetical protein
LVSRNEAGAARSGLQTNAAQRVAVVVDADFVRKASPRQSLHPEDIMLTIWSAAIHRAQVVRTATVVSLS